MAYNDVCFSEESKQWVVMGSHNESVTPKGNNEKLELMIVVKAFHKVRNGLCWQWWHLFLNISRAMSVYIRGTEVE